MQRYDLDGYDANMYERGDGDWVKYEDVLVLIEALREIADNNICTGEDAVEMKNIAIDALNGRTN